jgi:hypothetical protein
VSEHWGATALSAHGSVGAASGAVSSRPAWCYVPACARIKFNKLYRGRAAKLQRTSIGMKSHRLYRFELNGTIIA